MRPYTIVDVLAPSNLHTKFTEIALSHALKGEATSYF